jgi:hypothetical protein
VTLQDPSRLQSGGAARKPALDADLRVGDRGGTRGMSVAVMTLARRHVAARNGIAAIVAALALCAGVAAAEGPPQLILPIMTAMAVASAASSAPQTVAVDSQHRPILSLLPSQLEFQDGYEIDVDDYIGRHAPVALVDVDRIASFDVMRRRRWGWMASFAYDEERAKPMPGSSEVFRFVIERRF